MKILAIVITYNGMKWYDRCLGSLRESEIPVKTIVIDNASNDGTVEYIKEHFPDIHLIESKKNLGFAKANNIGIRYAIDHDADYVFLLNQDAWVEKDTLTKLVQTFEDNENVGIASPIHLNGSCSGLDKGFSNYMKGGFVSDVYMGIMKGYYEVPFINAAAWLISSDCIKKVGGFDTLLFVHYGEDNNYCQRVCFHGYGIWINTTCTICHDRECRTGVETCTIERNPFENINEKISYGNINNEININDLVKKNKIYLLMSVFLFSFKRIRRRKKKLVLLEMIKKSREMNKKGGLVWL